MSRLAAAGFGFLGLLLFTLSVVMILVRQPSALDLAIGLVGVLLLAPATYVLLDRRRRA